jgi:hypothetical protein
MIRSTFAAAAVAVSMLAAGAALAQAPTTTRVEGKLTAVSDSQLVLTQADGTPAAVPLLPGWSVRVSKPISIDAIAPGSYLGTTNYAKPDGTGTSLEVHVSPPGVKGPGVDFVMDAGAGTTMTNGVVGTVTQSPGGRVLSVDYGHGVRTITVPPGVPVLLSTPGDKSMLVPGAMIMVVNFVRGAMTLQFVTVETK